MDLILLSGFTAFVGFALFVDLFWLRRKGSHVVPPKEALGFTAMWVTSAIIFGVIVAFEKGAQTATEFFTGYLVEYSLSIDNVFVFTMVFAALKTPKRLQQKALIFGIIMSLVMRFGMILVGAALVERFEIVLYGFGIFLIITGIQMLRGGGHMGEGEPGAIRFARRFVHVSTDFDSDKLRVRHGSKLMWTPLFLAIVVIGIIDLVFAVDSIPAIFGITKDPFVVFTSNAFAILGLRSLYFLLADAKDRFRFLSTGLAIVLIFIGSKMAVPIAHVLVPAIDVHIDPVVSLLVVVGILGGSIGLSLARPPQKKR
ncbi:MAG: TerC/Alx family metal homeostasis membrane protein [Candidatus Limnocylindrus sp.]